MNKWLDGTRPPRRGEDIELDKLEPYLRQHLPGLEAPLTVEQFPSGHSNLTYLLRSGDSAEWVLRRPPFGSRVKTAHDMGREYRVLSKLSAVYPPAPRVHLYCDDESLLGAPFYVMERRRGVVLRKELPPGLELGPAVARRLCESLVEHLAALHALDYEAVDLGDLGRPEGYVERQVKGWAGRYQKARTDEWPEVEAVSAWLVENLPPDSGAAVVHNDYKYDNLVLDPEDLARIVAVLDWEMCTLGDPLMDLGTTLAYWTEATDDPHWRAASFGPTSVAGSFTRRELAEYYSRLTDRDVPNLVFYFCFGLFKLAVIVQQIYYRYAAGHTRDPRFADFHRMVALLGSVAARAIERDEV